MRHEPWQWEDVLKICFNEKLEIPFSKFMDLKKGDLDKYLGKYSSKQVQVKVGFTKVSTQLLLETNGKISEAEAIGDNYFMHAPTGYFFEFVPGKGELQIKEIDSIYYFKREN